MTCTVLAPLSRLRLTAVKALRKATPSVRRGVRQFTVLGRLAAVFAAFVVALSFSGSARAAAPLSWGAPVLIDHQPRIRRPSRSPACRARRPLCVLRLIPLGAW